jgi:hypothetical protein
LWVTIDSFDSQQHARTHIDYTGSNRLGDLFHGFCQDALYTHVFARFGIGVDILSA